MALLLLVRYFAKKLITHSNATLLVMKRLCKQYFHLTNASGILKGQQWISLKELSSTFAVAVKFAVSIKGIENAFDKRIPRNSEYGTSNKNFYIQVFWTRCTLKRFVKANMITPCCTLLNHSQSNSVKPSFLPQGKTDLWVHSGIIQEFPDHIPNPMCTHTDTHFSKRSGIFFPYHTLHETRKRILRIQLQNPSASWDFPNTRRKFLQTQYFKPTARITAMPMPMASGFWYIGNRLFCF